MAAIPGETVARGQLVTFYHKPAGSSDLGGSDNHDRRSNIGTEEACRQDDSCEKTDVQRDGDHFTETHELRPGPHLAEKVVPSETVTDTLKFRTAGFPQYGFKWTVNGDLRRGPKA